MLKVSKLNFQQKGEDKILFLDKIKIKDAEKWQDMRSDSDMQEVTKDIMDDFGELKKLEQRITNRRTN